jgi:hypothetical protein
MDEDQGITWVLRCMIVTAAMAPVARAFAAEFGPGGTGMWTVPLGPPGATEPTHFISSGFIDKRIADALGSAEALQAGAAAFDVEIPLEVCAQMLAAGHISDISETLDARPCMEALGVVPLDVEVPMQQEAGKSLKELLGAMLL